MYLLTAYVSLLQVRIVHEAMKFPLWLHGRTTITFLVVSTFPKKGVGKMLYSRPSSVIWYMLIAPNFLIHHELLVIEPDELCD